MTTLDQVCAMKQTLLNEVEKFSEQKNLKLKNVSDELISNWDAKFKTKGIKLCINKSQMRSFSK